MAAASKRAASTPPSGCVLRCADRLPGNPVHTPPPLIVLSCFLIVGISQERAGLLSPWVVASIAFMALEAVCCVYSNVLRDHINKRFDTICKVEMSFFTARVFINILALWGVLKFYRNLRAGFTYKDPEAIEL
ncbi:uncharacterized protein LOC135107721 [Scylla paramamosain]|uniref:uncharacterized protein LOC135107721 n=1 Tax=Scylla paramamosain TaxID=85552 RepID=UPI0030839C69